MGERVIREVRCRPILWDPKNKHHHNRTTVDSEWLQVAESLNETKEVVKMKWKNLRDSFRKELKKIEIARLQDDDQNRRHHGNWTHYESMQFLRDIMHPKLAQGTENSTTVEAPALEIASIDIKQELEKQDSDNESFKFNVNSNKNEASSESQISVIYPTHNTNSVKRETITVQNDLEELDNSWPGVEVSVDELKMARKRKAQISSNYLNCMRELLDLKAKKMSILKERSEEEYDDDMNFFKSLMPHVKQLPSINKLFFRSQVQNALAQELSKLETIPRLMPQCDSNVPSALHTSSQSVTFESRNDIEYENIIS